MTEAQLSLLADTRLSPRARLAGLFLSEIETAVEPSAGASVEVSSASLEGLLGGSWDVLRRDVKALETNGWIERETNTGKGHSPEYRFLAYANSPPYEELRVAFLHTLNFSLGEYTTLKPFGMGGSAQAKQHRSSRRYDVVVVVDERAREKSEDEILRGCRGSLRDYLAGSVAPPRQYQYVQTLIGWLGGTDAGAWKKPDGSGVAPEKRTELLAAALNELGASDETKYKRPVGDPANLRTKMNIILRQAHQPASKAGHKNEDQAPVLDPERWKKGAIDGSYL